MKSSEWLDICAFVANLWPTQPWNPSTATASYELFQGISAHQAREAVRLLAEDGREFTPPPGVVLATARTIVEARPALPEPDLLRDLTTEEEAINAERVLRLRQAIQDLADKKTLEPVGGGEFRVKLPHSHLPRTKVE